ncbi:succinyldiaminopimelate transaminase [Propionibacterium australiense]|uniref:Aminotransferase n=1 Tax=Propionibacterium australiense TaxID=119981 RepID=A0A383S6C9_9ACTN|nr:succinyldiaminopimelate transaminase [Propionibacterium australiense]RLP09633.1 succinyldiaminopimelate transaminase [Propionibacterium australiense]RLP12335.1 succinyldiaminopimelate transaminase [Propionibacterium australiense]SYZ33538.1 Aminotransferase class I and II [Propionibacterium australiense]VEH89617.1 LL-diaminopimelate aminotransferase [Propionibacterium australiense]
MSLSQTLPAFPWDSLARAKALADSHEGGIVDLSVGTPVDPTPQIVREALEVSSQAPGYPTVWGTPELRAAIVSYFQDRWASVELDEHNVTTAVGTKELVAWLPTLLSLGPGDTVVLPRVAYPTYEVGALMAGAAIQRCDDPDEVEGSPRLIWVNSPANPHGAIASLELLRRWVGFAREHGAVLAADECYAEFAYDATAHSILAPAVNDGDITGLLAVHSLSKRSNMAGYRAGFIGGDAALAGELTAVRKHLGMMVPAPVQAAMVAALGDQRHVDEQRARYAARRARMRAALERAGFRIDHSEGSLYLWATQGRPGRESIDWLAGRGILAAPGDFYGPHATDHVRVSMTAADERIAAAVERLTR